MNERREVSLTVQELAGSIGTTLKTLAPCIGAELMAPLADNRMTQTRIYQYYINSDR